MVDRAAFEAGYRRALDDALQALDGHNFHDTAHDRIKHLRACGECDHQPERHGPDGVCMELVGFPGRGFPCGCAEYELVAP